MDECLLIWLSKFQRTVQQILTERVLVAHEAVDGEAGLVSDAEAALAEDVEALRLRRQQHLPQPLVPRLEPRDLVYYHLGNEGIDCSIKQYCSIDEENDLSLDRHAEAEGPAAVLSAAGASGDGAAAAHDGRRRRALPHDTGGEDDASLGVCDLDPLGVGLVERLHRDQPHLPLLPSQRDHQLLALQVLHLQTKERKNNGRLYTTKIMGLVLLYKSWI